MSVYVSCSRISELRGVELMPGCCNSCHEDNEECGMDLCAIDGPDGHIGAHSGGVCCNMSRYLDEHPLTIDEWLKLKWADA